MTIVTAIKNALIRFDLPISKCRGQTYDGVFNMMGEKSQSKNLAESPNNALSQLLFKINDFT